MTGKQVIYTGEAVLSIQGMVGEVIAKSEFDGNPLVTIWYKDTDKKFTVKASNVMEVGSEVSNSAATESLMEGLSFEGDNMTFVTYNELEERGLVTGLCPSTAILDNGVPTGEVFGDLLQV